MADKEHRDLYIAAAVGGVGLILVLLYMSGGAVASAPGPSADTAETAPAGQSDYNYNIAPYNPAPLITNGHSALPAVSGGCCDDCGPNTGSQYNNVNTAQFLTLLGTGSG